MNLSPESRNLSRPTKSKTDDQRQIPIWPAHPLLRLIWRAAFTESECSALSIISGKIPNANIPPHEVISAALIAGWTTEQDKIIAAYNVEINTDKILAAAARGGHVAAMRAAARLGTTNFNRALASAAAGGHIEAMREAVRMGANAFNRALACAAAGGHIKAMHEAYFMGATDLDYALLWAAHEGHVAAMIATVLAGATDFNRALVCARDEKIKGWLRALSKR